MPYEIIVTQADDLSVETIGFGEDQAKAERIFNFTTQTLMRDGHILIGNIKNPQAVEVVQRGGPSLMFIELRYRPQWDIANIFALFNLLALEVLFPRYLGTGLMQAEVVKSEHLWATAEYFATETTPKGTVLEHALPGDRTNALRAFEALVQARRISGDTVRRNVDGLMKYSAMGKDGLTMFEFLEARK